MFLDSISETISWREFSNISMVQLKCFYQINFQFNFTILTVILDEFLSDNLTSLETYSWV